MSDLFVGFGFCFRSFACSPGMRSSGAEYLVVPPLLGVEALADRMFIVMEQSPKSERRGVPVESTRILG